MHAIIRIHNLFALFSICLELLTVNSIVAQLVKCLPLIATKDFDSEFCVRVRTHDQNFVPLIICNKIVTLLKINIPSCQINDPPSQINVPHCQTNVVDIQKKKKRWPLVK